jgi:hypothetical protein
MSGKDLSDLPAVGSLLQQGIPMDSAVAATLTVAEFVRKGMVAQQAVDEILTAYDAEKTRKEGRIEAR